MHLYTSAMSLVGSKVDPVRRLQMLRRSTTPEVNAAGWTRVHVKRQYSQSNRCTHDPFRHDAPDAGEMLVDDLSTRSCGIRANSERRKAGCNVASSPDERSMHHYLQLVVRGVEICRLVK
jgi:hypothetical protein